MALGNEEEEAKDYSSETAEAESSDAGEAKQQSKQLLNQTHL